MRRAAAVVLFLGTTLARAHPGHDEPVVHLHGFSPEMILLAMLIATWLLLRSR